MNFFTEQMYGMVEAMQKNDRSDDAERARRVLELKKIIHIHKMLLDTMESSSDREKAKLALFAEEAELEDLLRK